MNYPVDAVQGCCTKFKQNPLLLASAGLELPSKLSVCTKMLNGLEKLYTGTFGELATVVAELNTIPQILSTQTTGVPSWALGSFVLVAQGMVNQSVEH